MELERTLFANFPGFFSPGQPQSDHYHFMCEDCTQPMALLEDEKIALNEGELLRCLYQCDRCHGELAFIAQLHPDGRLSVKEWSVANGKSFGN